MNKILSLITDLEIEAEKLEPSRKEALLDLIDAFEAAVKQLLADDEQDDIQEDTTSMEEKMEALNENITKHAEEPELTNEE